MYLQHPPNRQTVVRSAGTSSTAYRFHLLQTARRPKGSLLSPGSSVRTDRQAMTGRYQMRPNLSAHRRSSKSLHRTAFPSVAASLFAPKLAPSQHLREPSTPGGSDNPHCGNPLNAGYRLRRYHCPGGAAETSLRGIRFAAKRYKRPAIRARCRCQTGSIHTAPLI